MDEQTRWRLLRVLHAARKSNRDLLEELDRGGWVLTPARRREVELGAITGFRDSLGRWRPAELLRRKFRALQQCTPADMLSVVQGYLEEYIEHRRQEP